MAPGVREQRSEPPRVLCAFSIEQPVYTRDNMLYNGRLRNSDSGPILFNCLIDRAQRLSRFSRFEFSQPSPTFRPCRRVDVRARGSDPSMKS